MNEEKDKAEDTIIGGLFVFFFTTLWPDWITWDPKMDTGIVENNAPVDESRENVISQTCATTDEGADESSTPWTVVSRKDKNLKNSLNSKKVKVNGVRDKLTLFTLRK